MSRTDLPTRPARANSYGLWRKPIPTGLWTKPALSVDLHQQQSNQHTPDATPLSPSQAKRPNPGRRFSQIVKLKENCLEEYKEAHKAVWPEVLKQIKGCNIQDYSIAFDPETNILFATFRYVGYDYAGDMQRMRENPKVREWWKMTDAWQESLVPGATSSESGEPSWWKPLEQVFYQA